MHMRVRSITLSTLAVLTSAHLGRSVEVRNGNVGEALAQLQTILQRNRVQAEIRATSRHEKKGEKRRRLRSQRWRRRFAHEVGSILVSRRSATKGAHAGEEEGAIGE